MKEMGSENKNQVTLSVTLKILSIFQKVALQSLEASGSLGADVFKHEAWWSIASLKQCIGASGALLLRHLVNASELFPIQQS